MSFLTKPFQIQAVEGWLEYIESYNLLYRLPLTPPSKTRTQQPKGENHMAADDHDTLEMDSILSFGKHNGKQVEDLIEDHPSYLKWMYDNSVRNFDEEVRHVLEEKGII